MPASVKITHIIWRNGEPRFVPGPGLRRLGLSGKDLKHPHGVWYSFEQAKVFSAEIDNEAKRLKAIARGDDPDTIPKMSPAIIVELSKNSVGQMVRDVFRRSEFLGQTAIDGRKVRKPLAAKTVLDYSKTAKFIESDHPDIWQASATALNKKIIIGLLEQVEVKRGLAQARKARAFLSMCYSRSGHEINPVSGVRLPGVPPRVKAASYNEITHLIAIADAENRYDIGDMIMLGVFSGQRQSDRFHMNMIEPTGNSDGEFKLRQIKTGALVDLPAAGPLQERIDAARERRKKHKVQYVNLCIDEGNQTIWDLEGSHYRKTFARIRDLAAVQFPYLKDFRDQDLRDTAVTWLANAGCTIPQICSITGHSEGSAHQVLKHYLARHPDQAAEAIKKVVAWYNKQAKK